ADAHVAGGCGAACPFGEPRPWPAGERASVSRLPGRRDTEEGRHPNPHPVRKRRSVPPTPAIGRYRTACCGAGKPAPQQVLPLRVVFPSAGLHGSRLSSPSSAPATAVTPFRLLQTRGGPILANYSEECSVECHR